MSQKQYLQLVTLYSQDNGDLLQESVLLQLAREIKQLSKISGISRNYEVVSNLSSFTESLNRSLMDADNETLENLFSDKAMFSLLSKPIIWNLIIKSSKHLNAHWI